MNIGVAGARGVILAAATGQEPSPGSGAASARSTLSPVTASPGLDWVKSTQSLRPRARIQGPLSGRYRALPRRELTGRGVPEPPRNLHVSSGGSTRIAAT